jgi:hypothetical protein
MVPRLSTVSKRVPGVRAGNGKRLGLAAQSKGMNTGGEKKKMKVLILLQLEERGRHTYS